MGHRHYWNAYVGNLEMHGKGKFYDPRLDNAEKYPVAARTRQGHKDDGEDRITAKLPALHFYQLSLPSPKPPPGTFNAGDMAQPGRGEVEGRFPIREGPDDAGPPPDLAQDAFERIVRADAPPMLLREGVVGQRFFDRRAHELGGPGQPQRRQGPLGQPFLAPPQCPRWRGSP